MQDFKSLNEFQIYYAIYKYLCMYLCILTIQTNVKKQKQQQQKVVIQLSLPWKGIFCKVIKIIFIVFVAFKKSLKI